MQGDEAIAGLQGLTGSYSACMYLTAYHGGAQVLSWRCFWCRSRPDCGFARLQYSTHLQLLLVAVHKEAHAVGILKIALLDSSILHSLGFNLHMSRPC